MYMKSLVVIFASLLLLALTVSGQLGFDRDRDFGDRHRPGFGGGGGFGREYRSLKNM